MTEAKFWYPASITKIVSINDSFDSCMLRVCYAGENRNKTIISKEAIEKAIPTMAYCPLVANYDVESDTIGGHDVDFVDSENGLKMVNLTDAVGVVPENPQWAWEKVTENDGTEREYLSTPAILWKRTPVYEKLKKDGVSGQSMEIRINDGEVVDGLFEINSFSFTAFCLLGEDVEPCFESAQVGLFSADKVGARLGEMMEDFKREFSKVMTAASADDNISTPKGEEKSLKGGEDSLNRFEELLKKYELTSEDITFETDGLSDEELEQKFSELHDAKFADEEGEEEEQTLDGEDEGMNEGAEEGQSDGQGNGEDRGNGEGQGEGQGQGEGESEEPEPEEDDDDNAPARKQQFSLTGEQLRGGVLEALKAVTIQDEWGSWPRYCYADFDPAAGEVYAYDNEDWNLYGFKYTMNGDNVVIDFNSKARKKLAFVDFEEGEAQFNYKHLMDSADAKFAAVAGEVANLRTYKLEAEKKEHDAKAEEVFAKFADLAEDDRFKALRENCEDLSVEDIEDKCFAIRGRNMKVNFSLNTKPVRLPVEREMNNNGDDEPYGGLFVEYGRGNR